MRKEELILKKTSSDEKIIIQSSDILSIKSNYQVLKGWEYLKDIKLKVNLENMKIIDSVKKLNPYELTIFIDERSLKKIYDHFDKFLEMQSLKSIVFRYTDTFSSTKFFSFIIKFVQRLKIEKVKIILEDPIVDFENNHDDAKYLKKYLWNVFD